MTQTRSRSRSAARLAAVQALYQQEMEGTPLPRLLHEFHEHLHVFLLEAIFFYQPIQDLLAHRLAGY